MSTADALSQQQRAARARWKDQVPARSAEITIERFDELSDATVARLADRLAERVAASAAEDGDEHA